MTQQPGSSGDAARDLAQTILGQQERERENRVHTALRQRAPSQMRAYHEDLGAIQFGQTTDWVEHTAPGAVIDYAPAESVLGMHLEFEVAWMSGTAGTPQVGVRIVGVGDISFGNLNLPAPAGAFVFHRFWATRAIVTAGPVEVRFIHWMPGGTGGVDEWRNVRMLATVL